MKSIIQVLLAFFIVFFGPQIQQDSTAQISVKKCSVCGKPVNNCEYRGNHPNCNVCGSVKENCPYRGSHPVIQKEIFTVNGESFVMIKVEGKGKPYYIGETEVTQALWQAVMGTDVRLQKDKANSIWLSKGEGEGSNYPIYYVNCDDCDQFIRILNNLTDKTFRLPSESEWEYAAKGGKYTHNYKYSGSNNLNEVGWYFYNSNYNTHPVKCKKANELGIYDMSGNVEEWTSTMYDSSNRVLRGGSRTDDATHCRIAIRHYNKPSIRTYYNGFRLAL